MIGRLLRLACNGCGRLLQSFLPLELMARGRIGFNTQRFCRTVYLKRSMERIEETFFTVFGSWILFGSTGLIRRMRL